MPTPTHATARNVNTYYVILISGAAALGGFLFGFDAPYYTFKDALD